jgi:hypothetical protein
MINLCSTAYCGQTQDSDFDLLMSEAAQSLHYCILQLETRQVLIGLWDIILADGSARQRNQTYRHSSYLLPCITVLLLWSRRLVRHAHGYPKQAKAEYVSNTKACRSLARGARLSRDISLANVSWAQHCLSIGRRKGRKLRHRGRRWLLPRLSTFTANLTHTVTGDRRDCLGEHVRLC